MVRVIFSPKSLRQTREIAEYIAKDSKRQSARIVGRIFSATKRLERFPELGAVIPEETRCEIREIRVFRYRILYQFQENESLVRIVAIVHGARRLTDDMVE